MLARLGRVGITDALHCRVRYMTEGVAIGSQGFVESCFTEYRSRFGPKRTRLGAKMWGSFWDGLWVTRNVRKDVYVKPRI